MLFIAVNVELFLFSKKIKFRNKFCSFLLPAYVICRKVMFFNRVCLSVCVPTRRPLCDHLAPLYLNTWICLNLFSLWTHPPHKDVYLRPIHTVRCATSFCLSHGIHYVNVNDTVHMVCIFVSDVRHHVWMGCIPIFCDCDCDTRKMQSHIAPFEWIFKLFHLLPPRLCASIGNIAGLRLKRLPCN